jgi:hypothetical protein
VTGSAAEDFATARARLGWCYLLLSLAAAVVVAVILAIPTAIIDNSLFTRMTPVEPEQYVFWIVTSLLSGALIATYLSPRFRRGLAGPAAGAGLLGVFAVGCPICNKLVVALLGTSGALSYFAPIQPLIGLGAVALAGWALWIRLRVLRDPSCPLPGASA